MTGIFLLMVVGLWLSASFAVAIWLLRQLQPRPWRWLIALAVFVAMLVAPVADEIVGGAQFRAMCAREAVLTIDAAKVRGRTVKRIGAESYPTGTVLRIRRVQYRLIDADTGEEMGNYATLSVWGGWFIRALGISEGNAPLLVNPAECDPRKGIRLQRAYEFVLIDN
jgi:hypothetical protein